MPIASDIKSLVSKIIAHGGDPMGMPFLEEFRQRYADLSQDQRLALFEHMALELEAPVAQQAAPARKAFNLTHKADIEQLLKLRDAMEPPRIGLLREFVNLPNGIKFLVDMRADLIAIKRKHRDLAHLELVDADLMHLFHSWFHCGFLELVPINWQVTPAGQLEKLMSAEAVHPMTDWKDLRRRLEKDRLCYAFYHAIMPDEPLIFVEIALTRTIYSSIDKLFAPASMISNIEQTTTALFYSINATQAGLAGVSLGNSLIKTVVAELRKQYPHLKRFATLSPAPGFRDRYLEQILDATPSAEKFSLKREQLESFFDGPDVQSIMSAAPGTSNFADALHEVLGAEQWHEQTSLRYALKPGMLRLMHHYLAQEKRGKDPLNPVANFHLKNGAILYNINYLSNTSAKGMAESYGMTVNYHYDLNQIDTNQQLARQGQCVVSPQLEKMLSLGMSA